VLHSGSFANPALAPALININWQAIESFFTNDLCGLTCPLQRGADNFIDMQIASCNEPCNFSCHRMCIA